MEHSSQYRVLARYNRWMNERLYTLAGERTDEDRKRDMGAFFRSIHGTFNHQTHHRGQLTTLLSQLGRDPGVTDLVAMLRAAPPDAAHVGRQEGT